MLSEDAIHQKILVWFNNNYCLKKHNPRHIIFHVPNQGKDRKEQLRKSFLGVLAGVSDLIILANGKTYFIEVKDDKGRQSPKQIEFQNRVKVQGFNYIVVRSLNEFKSKIRYWDL